MRKLSKELCQEIDYLFETVIFYSIVAFILLSIIGYFLSLIFIKPITLQREKMDFFIKDMIHELNTPVSSLYMSISTLEQCENKKLSKRLKVSINRIESIYNDLCYLLKNELNQIEQKQDINLKEIVENQILLIEGYSSSKNIKIEAYLDSVVVQIDRESANRMVNNIILNAVKYSKPNRKVEVILKNSSFIVKDYGEGISKSQLETIKKRYCRANKDVCGFGIGLDIVCTICKKYDIQMSIDSYISKGSEVKLKF